MARRPPRPLRRRKLVTEATRWNVYNDAGEVVGVIDLHPSPDVPNRFMARRASFPGAGTLDAEIASYKTHFAAARSIRAWATRQEM